MRFLIYIVEVVVFLLAKTYMLSNSIITKVQILLIIDFVPVMVSYTIFLYQFIMTGNDFLDIFFLVFSAYISLAFTVHDLKEEFPKHLSMEECE